MEQPDLGGSEKQAKLDILNAQWTMVVKAALSTILSKAVSLETLDVGQCSINVATHPSVLEILSMYLKQLRAAKMLGLNIAADDTGGRLT